MAFLYKKEEPLEKKNYCSVTLFTDKSSLFEKLTYEQINNYMENKLSTPITGFQKSHEIQKLLITMLKKWKSSLDESKFVSAIFVDPLKTFDIINHYLLLAKLHAHGFSDKALNLIFSYLIDQTRTLDH